MMRILSAVLVGWAILVYHGTAKAQDVDAKLARKSVASSVPSVQLALGVDKVDSILEKALLESVKKTSQSFTVTDESLAALQSAGVPESVLEKLKKLKGQKFEDYDAFENAVVETIGKDETKMYKDVITRESKDVLVVTDEFLTKVKGIILSAQPPSNGSPEGWLTKGFQRFLYGYIAHTKLTSGSRNTVTLRADGLTDYLKAVKVHCGELPCPGVPPCCGDCDVCE